MSVNSEKSETKTRVTRSMRRLNSESESIDLDHRPETPTSRTRKKLETVDTPTLTPSKRTTRASSAQRNLIEEVVASPVRRTRRTSTDRPVDSPMKMTRSMRLSSQNLNESEDEELPTPRVLKNARVTLVKLEEVVEEETETKLNTSADKMNDLELRNRSVSKSPADAPLNKSLNTSNGKAAPSLSEEIKAAEKRSSRHEIFDYNKEDGEDQNDSITEELAPREESNGVEKEASEINKSKVDILEASMVQEGVENAPQDEQEISVLEKTKADNLEVSLVQENEQSQIESMEVDASVLATTQYGDLTDTSLRVEARMTQYEELESMMEDFVPETDEAEKQEVAEDSVFESAIKEQEQDTNIKEAVEQVIETISNDLENVAEKSPQKSPSKRKSNSWSTAVVGSTTDRIDTFVAPTTEEPIAAPEKSPKKASKLIDSESEDEEEENDDDERNSLIDDEAMEVGSDEESMTKSERDEMEQNEIIEDGESLGSDDSDAGEIESENEDDDYDSKDSFLDDDENLENQYEMGESEEEIEEISDKRKKRRSRIIEQSSSDEEEGEIKEQSANESPEQKSSESSPQKSPSKSPKQPVEKIETPKIVANEVEEVKSSKRLSARRSLPLRADTSIKSRNSIPSSWRVEDVEQTETQENQVQVQNSNDRKRKRDSVVHGATPKRFREMSPNESEAVHMENVEEVVEEVPSSSKKAKKSKEPSVDIEKILERCEEHLEKHTLEKKSKIALKRKKQEEKKAKKSAKVESVEASPGSDDKENSGEKKKKKKHKTKKQPLVAEIEDQPDDLATKLSKHQEKLEQKREKKRKKKEMKKDTQPESSGNEKSISEEPSVVTKKKKPKVVDVSNVLDNTTQSKSEVTQEKKSKKRRIEETDDDIIERPKAKKKLNILQQVEDPSQRPRTQGQGTSKSTKESEVKLQAVTVSSKLKSVIPKALDKKPDKKVSKKKGALKNIPEPRKSLPRPIWTSAGTFIEESIEPYQFKSTEYKPLSVAGSSSQFRVIPFEAKSKKSAMKNAKMEMLMKRNKAGRDRTMRNMKNLM